MSDTQVHDLCATSCETGKLVREDKKPLPFRHGEMSQRREKTVTTSVSKCGRRVRCSHTRAEWSSGKSADHANRQSLDNRKQHQECFKYHTFGKAEIMPTRIIIADDEAIQRMDLRDVLTKQGYLVIGEAGDGQSAVNLARELRPDLVIMDIRMPDMDGITAAETLTQEKIAPVLLLTAFGDQQLVERAKEAGVVNYVVKPLRESEVTPAIEVTLARYSEFRALEEETRTLTEKLETRKVVERAKGLLMEKQGLTEQEAFRKIQKASMNNRKSMREVAEAILLTNEM
jgi:two-component system, response regulator PdtaR